MEYVKKLLVGIVRRRYSLFYSERNTEMKKLLSILTISTLTASGPASLLANTSLTHALISNLNNDYLSIKEFKNIYGDIYRMTIDSKDNIYFGKFQKGVYVLKQGETIPTKIDGISNNIQSIAVDSKDNIYFGMYQDGVYVLKQGETIPTKIDGIETIRSIADIKFDKNNTIYFGTDNGVYVLKQGETIPTKIDGISNNIQSIAVDSKDNIYFGKFQKGVYVLKQGETIPTKIDGISNNIQSIAVDSKDNIYFGMYQDGVYVLKQGETIPTKIDGIETIRSIADIKFDKNNTIYFGTDNGVYVLKQGETIPTKIDGISNNIQSIAVDSKDNIYFGTSKVINILQTALSWLKTQSQFNLVYSTKTKTWTRSDLLSLDGELNIDIANPNIDKVFFDNIQQPQTNKHWIINIKPEIMPRDHNLKVMFTLDGKQYTSEVTVSMQAKIALPSLSVKQNLSNLIKKTDLGNILDNNDNTIFAAVNQKNSNVVDDFSQITIEKKDGQFATLTAKLDSKSYKNSVDVKYNVVPITVVDLQIDVTPTSSTTTVIKNYLGQINTSNLTNPVNTFYYANSENKITLIKPTPNSVITGIVYGCDDKWNKTLQLNTIDPTNGIKLDGSQLNTKDGKYVIELSDNLGHINNVYLQINEYIKDIKEYWNTDNGKQFEIWAKANGYDNIRGYSASQLNKLFADSKKWQQLASDSQFASAVAKWFKTNGKLSLKEPLTKEQIVMQLTIQIPNDIKIPTVNTGNYDINKISFELNKSEFNSNDKINITIKYNNAIAEKFTLQIKDSNTPDNKKDGDIKLWIISVVGILMGFSLAYWFFKRFVFNKYIYSKIIARRHNKLVEQIKKKEEEKKTENNKRVEK
jgi:predicted RNase H-like HicB family nuclease